MGAHRSCGQWGFASNDCFKKNLQFVMKILSFQKWLLLCHAHTYGSFITYWIRKVWSCKTLFWYSTVWIIVFWFHAKSQRYQIFKLGGRSRNKIWANTITGMVDPTIERIQETFALSDFASWEWGWSLAQISCLWNSSKLANTPILFKVARFLPGILAELRMQHARCNLLKLWAMNKGSSNQPS